MIEFTFAQAPEVPWKEVLQNRMERGVEVGRAEMPTTAAATLYYDAVDDRFVLELKSLTGERLELFDCEVRPQAGGMAIVFLRLIDGGAAVPTGHAYLRGKQLHARLRARFAFVFQVDRHAPHFAALAGKAHTIAIQAAPHASEVHDAVEDLSEADLKRLRGDKAIHLPKQTRRVTRS
jgi:hypothetical protein